MGIPINILISQMGRSKDKPWGSFTAANTVKASRKWTLRETQLPGFISHFMLFVCCCFCIVLKTGLDLEEVSGFL